MTCFYQRKFIENYIWKKKAKQDGRLPPAYFPSTNFVENSFYKDEDVFFLKETLSFYGSLFTKIKKSYFFLRKTSQLRWKRPLQALIKFDTDSTKDMPRLSTLKNFNFFRKSQSFCLTSGKNLKNYENFQNAAIFRDFHIFFPQISPRCSYGNLEWNFRIIVQSFLPLNLSFYASSSNKSTTFQFFKSLFKYMFLLTRKIQFWQLEKCFVQVKQFFAPDPEVFCPKIDEIT